MLRLSLSAALAATLFLAPVPALADDGLTVREAHARAASAAARSGAAFMVIENHRDIDDRLIAARSDVAERVELHTHLQDSQGVMRMLEVKDGFLIPAGAEHALSRGGDHVMFLGLTRPLNDGDIVTVTLVFETSGELVVEIPVDNSRADMGGHGHSHGHGHAPTN
jgi:periplasmic copper chaperone A